MKRVVAAAVALLIAGIACSKDSGDSAGAAAASTTAPPVAGATVTFSRIAYRVSTMPNAARCALLAETEAQQERGLMDRKDLSGFDGMLFVFSSPTTVSFWMKDTPTPLSIAWFDANGKFVSSADMAPCIGQGDKCPSYAALGPYRFALEVAQGGLGRLGIGPGSVLTTGGICS